MKRMTCMLLTIATTCGIAYGQQQPGSNYEHLKCYEHLIGNWEYRGPLQEDAPALADEGTTMVAHMSREWILDKNAIEMNWTIELQGGKKLVGKSLIGWDARDGVIITGGMTSLGAHNLASVTYDEATKTWTLQSKGVDGQGRETTATVVNRLVDADTYIWQSKNRTGGDMTGDSPKYTFKRVK